ncbi:hypothetical protein Tco_1128921, partial [Tanacetum coccineum]
VVLQESGSDNALELGCNLIQLLLLSDALIQIYVGRLLFAISARVVKRNALGMVPNALQTLCNDIKAVATTMYGPPTPIVLVT